MVETYDGMDLGWTAPRILGHSWTKKQIEFLYMFMHLTMINWLARNSFIS